MTEPKSQSFSIAGKAITYEVLSHLGIGFLTVLLTVATGNFHAPHAIIAVLGIVLIMMLFSTFSWMSWNVLLPTMVE